jgi:hypothetical protein
MGGALGAIGSFASAALPVVGAIAALGSITGVFDGLFGSDKKFPGVQSTIRGGQLVPLDAQDLSPEQYAQARDGVSQFNRELRAFAESWGPDAVASLERWSTDSRMDSAESFGKSMEEWLEEGTRVALYGAREGIARDFYEVSAAMGDSFTSAMEGVADSPEAITAARDAAIALFAQLLESVQDIRGSGTEGLLNLSKDNTEAADQLYWAAERMGQSVEEMLTNFSALEMGLVAMGRTADSFSHWSSPAFAAQVGADFAEGAGGMERFAAGYQVFYQQFLSQVERDALELDAAKNSITSLLGDDALEQYGDRGAFMDALEATDLSSEASRRLHGQLIALSGAFDLVFDAAEAVTDATDELGDAISGLTEEQQQTIQSFLDSIAPPPDGVEQWERLQRIMQAWGVDVPASAAALHEMAMAGELTDEQLLLLAEHSEELAAAFAYVSENADAAAEATRIAAEEQAALVESLLDSLRGPINGAEQWGRFVALMDRWGLQIPQNRQSLLALIESGALTDAQILLLAQHMDELGAAFDHFRREQEQAIQDQYDASVNAARANYDAQVDAINAQADAQRDAINASADAQRDAINAQADAQRNAYQEQVDAAREYVSELSSVVSTIESALRSLGYINDEVASLDRARAVRELSSLADSGRTPSAEEAERLANSITGSESIYGTQEQETAAEALIRADLESVMSEAEMQLEAAERTVERLEEQMEMIADWRDRQLEQAQAAAESRLAQADAALEAMLEQAESALEAQLEQAEAWREAELARLDEIAYNTSVEPLRAVDAKGDAIYQQETLDVNHSQLEETKRLREDIRTVSDNQVYVLDLMMAMMRKWDEDGLPPGRDDDTDPDSVAYVIGYEAA